MTEEDEEFQRIEREVAMRNKAMEREHHYVRPWQGLTTDEILEALIAVDPETKRLPVGLARFAYAIEDKLRERNK